MKQNPFRVKVGVFAAAALLSGIFFVFALNALAFNGPSVAPASGYGAIGSDASNNLSVGTSTTISGTRFLVVGSTSDQNSYAMRALQLNATPILLLRDDGSLSIATGTVSAGNTVIGGALTTGGALTIGGNITATGTIAASGNISTSGNFVGTLAANNISAAVFGTGNYAFQGGSLGVGTTTAAGLPQVLSVYGSGYFSTALGIGTTAVTGYALNVNGTTSAAAYCISGANCISAWPSAASGTVSSIIAGAGLSGGTITSSGTISLNVATSDTWSALQTFNNGLTVGGGVFTVTNTSTFNGKVTFNAKVTVGTIDPVYAIGGKNYATYVPAMTGEKEETAGLLTLVCANGASVCSTTIDFGRAVQGSDVWLFGKATNLPEDLSQLVVVLTPSFDGRAWYKKDLAAGTLTIYGDQAGEVSYRFTAPRFDAGEWLNTASTDEAPNFTIK